ncbi:SlyX family protein [Exilibacterium tricleocarpae]|uniref:Protein SlyX homolog n=2 Tax=Exilibacterium tricleocarpae TaxID=2591008 RepID=A0A545UA33_9GAMM|nr:SlyX family protein [Exilibacterium tricleocarpae]
MPDQNRKPERTEKRGQIEGAAVAQLRRQVEDLQGRLAFQEDTLQALNDVVARQDGEILALREQMATLAEKLKDLTYALELGGADTAQERPPHY